MYRKGRTQYKDGTVYEGTYKNDQREGTGTCHYSDGSVYEGTWAADVREGRGTLTYKDGSYYKGEWKNNLRHGKGVLEILGGAHYEGSFECGDYHGIGMLRTAAFTYTGPFIRGIFHGQGKLVTPEYTYEGEFEEGKQTGQGRMEYKDGTVYMGSFVDGLYNGSGRLLLPNGGVYEAQFKAGKIEDDTAHYITKSTNKYPSKSIINAVLSMLEPEHVSIFSDYLICYESDVYTSIWNMKLEPLARFISSCISPRIITSYTGSIKAGVLDGPCEVEYDNQFSLRGEYKDGAPARGTVLFKYTGDIEILDASETAALQYLKLSVSFSQYSNNVIHGDCQIAMEFKDAQNNSLVYKSKFVLDKQSRRQGNIDIVCNDLYFSGMARDDQLTGEGTLSVTNGLDPQRSQTREVSASTAMGTSMLESFMQSTATSKMGRSVLPGTGLTVVYSGNFERGLRSGKGTQQAGNLYHFVGQFKGDMMHIGVLTDYLCTDKVTNEHIARRTIGTFVNNTPKCPILVEVSTFRYRVYCSAPEQFPSVVTTAMRKLSIKTLRSTSASTVSPDDDLNGPMTMSQLQPTGRNGTGMGVSTTKFNPSYFLSFYEPSGSMESVVGQISKGVDINSEHVVRADVRTKNLKSVVFNPGDLTVLVPQFYAGTLDDMRLTGTGVMYYQLPSARLAVVVSGTCTDGYLTGVLSISIENYTETRAEYLTLSQTEGAHLVCRGTITGRYHNSILDGECTMDITVSSSQQDLPSLQLLFSGEYRLGHRKGVGSLALKRAGVPLFEYSGAFESDLPVNSGAVVVADIGIISGALTRPLKPEVYYLHNYFTLARYQKLLDFLSEESLLPSVCSFQGKVEVVLAEQFISKHLERAIGAIYDSSKPVKLKGYIDESMALYGEDVEITSGTFSYHGGLTMNELSGKGTLTIYESSSGDAAAENQSTDTQRAIVEVFRGTFANSLRSGDDCYQKLPRLGEEYVGSFRDNARSGPGRLHMCESGDIYEGIFVNDRLGGQGKLMYGDGNAGGLSLYTGEFVHGVPSGRGKLTFTDGSWYEGDFDSGRQTGLGTFYDNINDTLIEGAFVDGKPQEQCTYTFNYSDIANRRVMKTIQYDGDVGPCVGANNKTSRSSAGIYTVTDNNYQYTGAMKNGMFEGEGTLVFRNGITYTGSFVNGELSGLGKITNPVYNYSLTANFLSGEISCTNPYSMLLYANDDTNNGDSAQGYLPHKCIRTYMGPMKFKQQSSGGKQLSDKDSMLNDYCLVLGTDEDPYDVTLTPHNIATVHYTNGDIYRGGFYSDMRHGAGKAYSAASGLLLIGTFRNDHLCGTQTILSPNGEIETGDFRDGKPVGKHIRFINNTYTFTDAPKNTQEDGKNEGGDQTIAPSIAFQPGPIVLEQQYSDGAEAGTVEVIFKSSDYRYIGGYMHGIFYGEGKMFTLSTREYAKVLWKLQKLPAEFAKLYTSLCAARLELLNSGHTDSSESLYTRFNDFQDELNAQTAALTNPRMTPSARKGKLVYTNAEHYEGEILDGMQHGHGTLYSDAGEVKYEGEFRNNKRDGHGKLVYKKDKYYVGSFVNDLRHGTGEMHYPNKSVYIGAFSNDMRNGLGKMEFPDGSYYDGAWKQNEMWGQGVLRYKDGDKYEGDFVNNMKHGRGVMHLANGDVLSGTFVQDVMEGLDCEIQYGDGGSYKGQISAGIPHGKGVRKQANGDEYSGEFSYGQYHGYGTLKSQNGDVYIGQFACNKICGKGVMTYANGTVFEGEWIAKCD